MTTNSEVSLSSAESKLIRLIRKEKKAEIKEVGDYSGFYIPVDCAFNDLNEAQRKMFKEDQKTVDSLIKKKILQLVAQDRRGSAYDFID